MSRFFRGKVVWVTLSLFVSLVGNKTLLDKHCFSRLIKRFVIISPETENNALAWLLPLNWLCKVQHIELCQVKNCRLLGPEPGKT